jgi:hypothetical protein
MPPPVTLGPLLLPEEVDPELLPELGPLPPELLLPEEEPELLLVERGPLLLPLPELFDGPGLTVALPASPEPLLEPLPEFVEPLLFVAPPLEGVAPAWFDGPPAPVLATCGAHSLFVGGEPEHSQAPPANIATSEGETIHPIFLMVTPSNRLLGPRAP